MTLPLLYLVLCRTNNLITLIITLELRDKKYFHLVNFGYTKDLQIDCNLIQYVAFLRKKPVNNFGLNCQENKKEMICVCG